MDEIHLCVITRKEVRVSQRFSPACSLRSFPYGQVKLSVIVQIGLESSLLPEIMEKKNSDPILLQLNGAIYQQNFKVISQGVITYLFTRVTYVFQMSVC